MRRARSPRRPTRPPTNGARDAALLILLSRAERGALERARTERFGEGGPSLAAWARDLLLGAMRTSAPNGDAGPRAIPARLLEHLVAIERRAIDAALQRAHENQSRAADLLGISRRTLINKMEKHGFKARPPSRQR